LGHRGGGRFSKIITLYGRRSVLASATWGNRAWEEKEIEILYLLMKGKKRSFTATIIEKKEKRNEGSVILRGRMGW